ncbi:MAG: hypothetical protein ACQETI_12270 [Halobacteriota archaeon]
MAGTYTNRVPGRRVTACGLFCLGLVAICGGVLDPTTALVSGTPESLVRGPPMLDGQTVAVSLLVGGVITVVFGGVLSVATR